MSENLLMRWNAKNKYEFSTKCLKSDLWDEMLKININLASNVWKMTYDMKCWK